MSFSLVPITVDLKWTWLVHNPDLIQISTIGIAGPGGGGGGGTTNHAALTNLAYAVSGHTGFAGTGVSNTFTANQSITGNITVSGLVSAATGTIGSLGVTGTSVFVGDASFGLISLTDLVTTPTGAATSSAAEGAFNVVNSITLHLGRVSGGSVLTINGIAVRADGYRMLLVNNGDGTIILTHQSGSATAPANRIITPTGESITLAPEDSVDLFYDATEARWRVTGTSIAAELSNIAYTNVGNIFTDNQTIAAGGATAEYQSNGITYDTAALINAPAGLTVETTLTVTGELTGDTVRAITAVVTPLLLDASGSLGFSFSSSEIRVAGAGSGPLILKPNGLNFTDTGEDHELNVTLNENLTANRTLQVSVANANRTLSIPGNATISGTNTGDQTITLTGNVTGSGTGSFAATISNDAVTFAKMQNITADRLLGRYTTGTGDVQEITIGSGLSLDSGTGILTASGGGGGAPAAAQYVVLSLDGTLTNERTLAAGTALGLTDGGAGGNVTLAVNDAELVAIAGLTSAADRVPYFTGSGTAALAVFTSFGRDLVDSADDVAARSTLLLGTMAVQNAATVTITGGSISGMSGVGSDTVTADTLIATPQLLDPLANSGFNLTTGDVSVTSSTTFTLSNEGLRFPDTAEDHFLTVELNENLSANRLLNIIVSNDDRTLTLAGDATISGTNTGDQTITLTGDVTGSGTGSFAATIGNGTVTFAKMQDLTTDRLMGRDTAGTGDPEQITVGGGIEFTGSTGIQTSAFTGDVTKTAGGTATTIANDVVTFAKMQNIATDSLIGRDTASTGDPEAITVTGGIEFSGSASIRTTAFTGDVTKTAGGTALTIANDAVTYAKIQNVTNERFLARSAGSSGDVEEIAAGPSLRWRSALPNAGGVVTTQTAGVGGTATLNLNTSNRHYVTFGAGNCTIALSNEVDGDAFVLFLKQDSTGGRTVTWFSGIKWQGGTTPTLTTAANKIDVFTFVRLASGEYLGIASLNF